jgi:hypothetical protein
VHPIDLSWQPNWDAGNQNWMTQLTPASSDSLPAILQSAPPSQFAPGVRVPNLGGLTASDLRRISTH